MLLKKRAFQRDLSFDEDEKVKSRRNLKFSSSLVGSKGVDAVLIGIGQL